MGPLDPDVSCAIRAEGRQAFERYGEAGVNQCPYPIRDNIRTAWFEGFLQARTNARLKCATITSGTQTIPYDGTIVQ